MKIEKKSKYSRYINIGGVPYHRKGLLNGFGMFILAATDSKLSVATRTASQMWIDADSHEIQLAEKFQKSLW